MAVDVPVAQVRAQEAALVVERSPFQIPCVYGRTALITSRQSPPRSYDTAVAARNAGGRSCSGVPGAGGR